MAAAQQRFVGDAHLFVRLHSKLTFLDLTYVKADGKFVWTSRMFACASVCAAVKTVSFTFKMIVATFNAGILSLTLQDSCHKQTHCS